MRLVINYRGPRGTIPTYSFADLVEGRLAADLFKGRIVLIGASFIGIADSYPGPFGNTPIPGTERLANIVDTILAGDFIRENPPPWPTIVIGLVAVLAIATGLAAALLPTRLAAFGGAVPILGWAGGAQIAFAHGLWLPLVGPVVALGRQPPACCCFATALSISSAASSNRRSATTSRPTWSTRWRRIPSGFSLAARPGC